MSVTSSPPELGPGQLPLLAAGDGLTPIPDARQAHQQLIRQAREASLPPTDEETTVFITEIFPLSMTTGDMIDHLVAVVSAVCKIDYHGIMKTINKKILLLIKQ